MPMQLLPEGEVDQDRAAQALEGPSSFGLAFRTQAGQLTSIVGHAFAQDTQMIRPNRYLTPQQATEEFGIDGHLAFDKPIADTEAAFRQQQAQARIFREDVMSRASPLTRLGAGLGGGLADPAGWPLMFAPELMGVRAGLEAGLAARAAQAGSVAAKIGRMSNGGRGALIGGIEGIAGGVVYEAGAQGLRRYAGDDEYSMGDSLTNVLLGGVLGAGIGGLAGAISHGPHGIPPAVRDLSEEARLGAHSLALEQMIADQPVRVTDAMALERRAPEGLSALDEVSAVPSLQGRMLDESVAVTTRGTEIPVRYALVEMGDLITSHDNDLMPNPGFPAALQPRDRTRAGSQAGNLRLEAELNPKRLMRDSGAETGAPLVSPDGVVESGNGRTIALRRSAATGSAAWPRYLDELKAQGFDPTGMQNPVLVRIRTDALDGQSRAALTREMNLDATERMGAGEQAMADAQRMDPATLADLEPGKPLDAAFTRKFIARVAPDQQNAFTDEAGRLSEDGARRIKAALIARAYGVPRLVSALFEGAETATKQIGEALAQAAPAWTRMRELAASGQIPPELDVTPQLTQAMDLVREARETRTPLAELVELRLAQVDMFGGGTDVQTADFLRLFFRDEAFKKPRPPGDIAAALNDYARQAEEVKPGPDLFGETPDAAGKNILTLVADKFARDEPFPQRADLAAAKTPKPGEPVVIDLRPASAQEPGRPEVQPPVEGPSRPVKADPMAGVDPELRALVEAEMADAAADGVDLAPAAANEPATIAEAIRAAAFCLIEGGGQ